MARSYSDQNPGVPVWSSERRAVRNDIEATVHYGKLPPIILEAIRAGKAYDRYNLTSVFGNAHSGLSIETQRDRLAEYEVAATSNEFESFPSFLTLEVCRPITLLGHPSARFLWMSDDSLTKEDVATFETTSSTLFSDVFAGLLPILGTSLQVDRIVFGGRVRAYVVADGKAPVKFSRFSLSGNLTFLPNEGWNNLPFTAIDAMLSYYASNAASISPYLREPSRWLAAAYTEEDTVLRFMFGFLGLEVLVDKMLSRTGTIREKILCEFQESPYPIKELLWPSASDENKDQWPDRNLVFKFAALASVVRKASAIDDTNRFKKFHKFRNELVHGNIENVDSLPAKEVIVLLREYVTATMVAIRSGLLN